MAWKDSVQWISLAALQLLVGLGAVPAGAALLWDPSGAVLGLRVAWLSRAPLPDYFIPGLFLFLVHGVGSLVAAALTLRRRPSAGRVAVVLGLVLVAWIGAQLAWLEPRSRLQPLLAAVGLLEWGLGASLARPATRP